MQKQVDAILRRTVPADLFLDSVFKRVGFQRGFGLDIKLWIPWHVAIIELRLVDKSIGLSISEKEKELKLGEKEICSRL